MNTVDDYEYCAVYVRGLPDRDRMAELVAQATAGRLHAETVYCDGIEIDVRANPDHDPAEHEFVFWPIKLDICIDPATPTSRRVEITAGLLTRLWSSGHDAVAACDYEDELPNQGGYPRNQR